MNSLSLVIRMEDRGRAFIFTGDIEQDAERYLSGKRHDLTCDVLKIPHHGSKSSSSEEFLARTRPKLAVVTVGTNNPCHHPADEVIDRYQRTGADLCRTDRDGAVIIRPYKDRLEVTRWSEMMLRRIDLADREAWIGQERLNWRRLWIRTWEI